MSKRNDVINRAYGGIPKETTPWIDLDWIPTPRGIKFYWIKIKRFFTR